MARVCEYVLEGAMKTTRVAHMMHFFCKIKMRVDSDVKDWVISTCEVK